MTGARIVLLSAIASILTFCGQIDVHGGTYRDALKCLEENARPAFLDQQIEALSEIEETPSEKTPVEFPEMSSLLEAYDIQVDKGLNPQVVKIDPALTSPEAENIQRLARTDRVEELLKAPLKLSTLQSIAYVRNRNIQSASEAWNAALARYPQAAYLDGILRQYNVFTKRQDLLLRSMQGQRQKIAAEFPFPGVTTLRGDLVRTDIEIAEYDFAIVVRDTLTEVKKAYFDYAYVQDAIQITKENQNLLEQILNVATRKFEAGKSSYNNVIKARMALSKLSDSLITLEEQKTTITARLNMLLDRGPQAPLGRSEYAAIPIPERSIDTLYELAKSQRQEIERDRYRVERVRLAIALAEKMNRPDPTLGASYFEDRSGLLVGAEPDRGTFRPDPTQPNRPWFGMQEAFIQEMRIRERQMEQALEEMINQTLYDVKTAHFSLDAARREIELYEKTLIPDARQSLEVAEVDYEGARIDFLDYLDAQRTLLEFNISLFNARRDFGKALAELERAVGGSLMELE